MAMPGHIYHYHHHYHQHHHHNHHQHHHHRRSCNQQVFLSKIPNSITRFTTQTKHQTLTLSYSGESGLLQVLKPQGPRMWHRLEGGHTGSVPSHVPRLCHRVPEDRRWNSRSVTVFYYKCVWYTVVLRLRRAIISFWRIYRNFIYSLGESHFEE